MLSKGAPSKGARLRANARPDNNVNIRPLTLYGWEGAPFVTPVRELLCELSIPHVLVNCAAGSANRYSATCRVHRICSIRVFEYLTLPSDSSNNLSVIYCAQG